MAAARPAQLSPCPRSRPCVPERGQRQRVFNKNIAQHMQKAQPGRRWLPNKRGSETFSLESQGLSYVATASFFEDGRLAEIFLNNHKADSNADIGARDAAIAGSIALQYGADLETIRKALCDPRGTNGPLGIPLDLMSDGTQ